MEGDGKDPKKWKSFLEQQILEIQALPQVDSVVVLERGQAERPRCIEVRTKELVSKPVWRTRYSLGSWKILYCGCNKQCESYQMTLECVLSGRKDKNTDPSKYLYPITLTTGASFCFGDNKQSINHYLLRREVFAATEVIIDCLTHVGKHKESDVRNYYKPVDMALSDETSIGRLERLAGLARCFLR